ncbi:uncharacterized protein LACBIDRAFT_316824 [Laccaria bicolor S238N-H82]|uniref:Predicted protein n=1 Tax=Laccaria bicolor (strain S238N-H82 / ATCC MYA-4686) TaxID=486041 RepID=B0E1P4_LACBS|nr:uncharacterized protein LACBIDRAFT_316824 [Laccaria bicolor S238N-H82]EDQ99231.1 predicted protein [Laccaria bicolor S238N-H82]|eukprot:XP_001890128.1 predicted protein [Laccaria bicolor S238N-H82]
MSPFSSEPQSTSTAGSNSSSGLYSLDGRGGEPGNGKPQGREATSPRYLYYRLYATDGAMKSLNPIYSNDPSISRILPKSLTPPHTALSLKRYLCKIEGLAESNASLFESLSSDVAIAGSSCLKLRDHLGLGASSREPMVLVVGVAEAEKRLYTPRRVTNKLIENPDSREMCYIYYRVYGEEGEVNSRAPFDERDTSLGHIDTLSIAPPRTVASLKSRIVNVEGIANQEIQLFEDTDGEVLLNDADHLPLFAVTYLGYIKADPLAVVYVSKTPSSRSTMTKAIRAKYDCSKPIALKLGGVTEAGRDVRLCARLRHVSTRGMAYIHGHVTNRQWVGG